MQLPTRDTQEHCHSYGGIPGEQAAGTPEHRFHFFREAQSSISIVVETSFAEILAKWGPVIDP